MSHGLLPRLLLEGLRQLATSSHVSHCQDKWQRLACAEVQLPRPAEGVPHQMFCALFTTAALYAYHALCP